MISMKNIKHLYILYVKKMFLNIFVSIFFGGGGTDSHYRWLKIVSINNRRPLLLSHNRVSQPTIKLQVSRIKPILIFTWFQFFKRFVLIFFWEINGQGRMSWKRWSTTDRRFSRVVYKHSGEGGKNNKLFSVVMEFIWPHRDNHVICDQRGNSYKIINLLPANVVVFVERQLLYALSRQLVFFVQPLRLSNVFMIGGGIIWAITNPPIFYWLVFICRL